MGGFSTRRRLPTCPTTNLLCVGSEYVNFCNLILRQTIQDKQFLHRAVGLIKCLIGEGRRSRIRVGDSHPAQALPADYVRPLFRRHVGIAQSVILYA
jgi:hypothetical protein